MNPRAYCYTLEVSFASKTTGFAQISTPYTEEAYHRLGRNVARTFLDFYKLEHLALHPRKESFTAGKNSSEDDSASSAMDREIKGKVHGSKNEIVLNRNSSDSSVDSNGQASLRLTHRKK